MTYDHIVIGVGGMGSATVCELARRGASVLGLERFDVLHEQGSSHGNTRIIRLGYNEHPDYVPLLYRAYEMWRALQEAAGEELLVVTGGLDIGPRQGRVVSGALQACQMHKLPHQLFDAQQLHNHYPGFVVPDNFAAVYQPDAGYLRPERCVLAHVNQARQLGAQVHTRETVLSWHKDGDTFTVVTDRARYQCRSLVITAGPWAAKLVPQIAEFVQPLRQVVGWFQPQVDATFSVDNCPVFILDVDEGEYYGFPVDEQLPGLKIGRYFHQHEVMDPDARRRDAGPEDEALLRKALRRYLPEADGATLALQPCLFTVTPDRHFLIDQMAACPGLTIGAGFSGHGFKFASVVGEILAELAINQETQHNIDLFALKRYLSQ